MCVVVIWFSSSSFQVGEIVKQIKLVVQQAPLPWVRAISPVQPPFWQAWAARQSRKTQNLQRKHLLTLYQKLLVFSELICFGTPNEGGAERKNEGPCVHCSDHCFFTVVKWHFLMLGSLSPLVGAFCRLSVLVCLVIVVYLKVAILAHYFWTRRAATTGMHWLI
jgi:hypothetical protein